MMEGRAGVKDGAVVVRVARIRRHVAVAHREQELAVVGELHSDLGAAVHQVDAVVRPDADAVGVQKHALAPGAQEVALRVEHHEGMITACEDVDFVAGVDGDAALSPLPAVGELAPALNDFILQLSG